MAEDNNSLHPEKGSDPRLTFCGRCKCNMTELVEGNNYLMIHSSGRRVLAPKGESAQIAQKLGWDPGSYSIDAAPEGRLPASTLCDSCNKELKKFAKVVKAGGVYWACATCQLTGVIAKSAYADLVRTEAQIKAPNPTGVEFPSCEEHELMGIKASEAT